MMGTANELLRMKEQIEKAKTDKAQAEGRLSQLMKDLLSKFGCKTLSESQKKLTKLDKKHKVLVIELDEGIEQLKEDYEWA
jgi:hypothetical protein